MERRGLCILLIFALALSLLAPAAAAQIERPHCAVYFTGIGCPHCAKTDLVVLQDLLDDCSEGLIVIEYEIYQESENGPLMLYYNSIFNTGLGIPHLLLGHNNSVSGDLSILQSCGAGLEERFEFECPLIETSQEFKELDLTKMNGRPKIWSKYGVLLSYGNKSGNSELLKGLILGSKPAELFEDAEYEVVEPIDVPLSGGSVKFDNAVRIGEWVFQWNGDTVLGGEPGQRPTNRGSEGNQNLQKDLGIATIFSLAAVDAVNPCALAVLSLMLIAIITYNPKKKKKVLTAGFAFVLAVFIMYLIYGLVIIKFFQIIQVLTSVRILLYQILGVAAIILGLLNIKDFIKYKPGGIATEMPKSIRPKVKALIEGVTSPKGAFVTGLFVTVFLLPCTIGPYVIAGGMLSALQMLETLPWLLVYNFIFILPMVAITMLVYGGISKVEDVSAWKDKNIRYLHLVAGVIILLLGIAMVLGLV